MKYTIFCPCHESPAVAETHGADQVVRVGDEMTCTGCNCIHRVDDVEAGAAAGRVRLVRMSIEDVTAAYASIGMTLIRVTCPLCAEECGALAPEGYDPSKAAVLFCERCHVPMMIESDGETFTAREPDEVERRDLVRAAIEQLAAGSAPSLASRIDALFPDTPYGDDPFAGGRGR